MHGEQLERMALYLEDSDDDSSSQLDPFDELSFGGLQAGKHDSTEELHSKLDKQLERITLRRDQLR